MVTIFGSNTCLYCLRCKQLCEAMEIEHEYLDVKYPEVEKRFVELFPNVEEIPQILWKDERIEGYEGLSNKINEYISNLNNYDQEKSDG